MSKRICICGRITADGYCDKCRPKAKARDRSNDKRTEVARYADGQRVYDHQWRKTSEAYRDEHPLCEDCLLAGRVEAATSVHHVYDVHERPELRLEWSNLRALCEPCHRRSDARRRHQSSANSR